MDIKELFYAMKIYYRDTYEALASLQKLEQEIINKPKKVAAAFKFAREEIALENGLCPNCLSEINTREINNENIEFAGIPVKEVLVEGYCSDCGWSEKDL